MQCSLIVKIFFSFLLFRIKIHNTISKLRFSLNQSTPYFDVKRRSDIVLDKLVSETESQHRDGPVMDNNGSTGREQKNAKARCRDWKSVRDDQPVWQMLVHLRVQFDQL